MPPFRKKNIGGILPPIPLYLDFLHRNLRQAICPSFEALITLSKDRFQHINLFHVVRTETEATGVHITVHTFPLIPLLRSSDMRPHLRSRLYGPRRDHGHLGRKHLIRAKDLSGNHFLHKIAFLLQHTHSIIQTLMGDLHLILHSLLLLDLVVIIVVLIELHHFDGAADRRPKLVSLNRSVANDRIELLALLGYLIVDLLAAILVIE